MQVIEDEQQRPCHRQALEQLPHRTVDAVPLVLNRHRRAGHERRERRKNGCELPPEVVLESREPMCTQTLDVLVERVDEYPERQVLLELRG